MGKKHPLLPTPPPRPAGPRSCCGAGAAALFWFARGGGGRGEEGAQRPVFRGRGQGSGAVRARFCGFYKRALALESCVGFEKKKDPNLWPEGSFVS